MPGRSGFPVTAARLAAWPRVLQENDSLLNAGAASSLALLYVMIAYSRFAELFLNIPMLAFMVGGSALAIALLSGSLANALQTKPGKLFAALTIIFIIGIPFSEWPGGSFSLIIREVWLKAVATYFLIAGTITTVPRCRRLMYAISLSIGLIVIAGVFLGGATGRFSMSAGTLANPNDFAVHVLLGVPFLFFVIEYKSLKSLHGLAALAAFLLTSLLVLKTGSRAGLLTFATLILYTFWRGSGGLKAFLAAMAVAGIMAAPFVISPEALDRYKTMFTSDSKTLEEGSTTRQSEFATASAEQRQELLKMSLETMATHPLLGVGAGMFSVATAVESKAEGKRAMWKQTHNSFTQVASEAGVPAGIIFIMCLMFAIKTRDRVRKLLLGRPGQKIEQLPADQQLILIAAKAVTCASIVFTVGAFFGNYAYALYLPMLTGCAYAVSMNAQRLAIRDGVLAPSKIPQLQKRAFAGSSPA